MRSQSLLFFPIGLDCVYVGICALVLGVFQMETQMEADVELPVVWTASEAADFIVDYVRKRDFVTNGELYNRHGEIPLRGNLLWTVSNSDIGTLVLFAGCTDLFCDVLDIFWDEKPRRIFFSPAVMWTLFFDACPIPAIPLVGPRIPKGGYKSTRFMPVVMRPIEKYGDGCWG